MPTAAVRPVEEFRAAPSRAGAGCEWMTLRELCAPLGAPAGGLDLPEMAFAVRSLEAGETLYRAGDRFRALYAVRSGFLKVMSIDHTGDEQVLAFPMSGDVLGLDGFDGERYASEASALEPARVAVVPFLQIAHLGVTHPCVGGLLYAAFGRELARVRATVWLLGMRDAEARVAAFLLELSQRFGQRGYSRTSLVLRMSRRHIGSYLGIRLETVSRAFSAFAAAGWITVERTGVTLRDVAALRRAAGGQDGPGLLTRREQPLTPLNERARQGRIVGIAERCA